MSPTSTKVKRKPADAVKAAAEGPLSAEELRKIRDKLIEHKQYICKHGDDMPEIQDWRWGQAGKAGGARAADTAADNV